jgi:hypothetical protein
MRKICDPCKKYFDYAVLDSLNTIKEARIQLRLLSGTSATAAVLASQIQLYDLLLDEISGIHAGLARDLKHTCLTLQAFSRPSVEGVGRPN